MFQFDGVPVFWFYGFITLILFYCATILLFSGFTVSRCSGFPVSRCSGSTVLRFYSVPAVAELLVLSAYKEVRMEVEVQPMEEFSRRRTRLSVRCRSVEA